MADKQCGGCGLFNSGSELLFFFLLLVVLFCCPGFCGGFGGY
ncbi:MAG: hypothetical protein N4A57_03050 [Anaeromicrobium sp.]|jgi:hypothetical protein|nr:hypothetical protein [Anaeromicrobium sp.]MCT4593238.1 hypothetical protein [Anaeromicrobium sp.]